MKLLQWLLTPLVWWALWALVPEGGDFVLAIDPATALIIAGVLGAGATVGGSLLARPKTTGTSEQFFKAQQASPLTGGAVDDQLLLQAAVQLGADPNEIAKTLFLSEWETLHSPASARAIASWLETADQRLALGDTAGAQQLIDLINQHAAGFGGTGAGGGTPVVRLENGRLMVTPPGAIGQQIEQLRAAGTGDIFQNRLTGLGNLGRLAADFPMATETDLQQLQASVLSNLRADIDRDVTDRTGQILQQANAGRINPAAILGRLEEQRSIQQRNAEVDSLGRAAQLLGARQGLAAGSISGIQGALSPTLSQPLLQFQNLDASAGQIGAAQQTALANLSAQTGALGSQALGAGVAGAGGQLADTLSLPFLLQLMRQINTGGPGTRTNDTEGLWNIPGPYG
jgi:hypothetical protein